jgi:hypothetical protein
MELKETVRFAHQRLRLMVTQIIKEELGDCVDGIRFTGSYEGEEFNAIITLHYEPDDFEKRDTRLHRRVWELGYDIGLFVQFPEETITV